MTWLVWRRQRVPLLVALGLVLLTAAVAVAGRFAWLAGIENLGAVGCLDGSQSGVCRSNAWYALQSGLFHYSLLLTLALVAVPGVAGAVAGAGLFAGETARGEHLFTLSQSVSRLRWFGHGLLVTGLPLALAVAAVLSPAASWWVRPFDGFLGGTPLRPDIFLVTGVVPAAYALLAFCVAAAAGLLLRSTAGALGLALAVFVATLLMTTYVLRPGYLPAERTVRPFGELGRSDSPGHREVLFVGSGYVDAQGREIDDAAVVACGGQGYRCLERAGATGSYRDLQPTSRYWPFQAVESGLLLALAAAALGVGLAGLRRRVH